MTRWLSICPCLWKHRQSAGFMLLSPNNLLKPSDGGPVAVPSQDMVLGIYYLTQERPGSVGEGMVFKSINEAILAYENKAVTLHSRVKVRVSKTMEDGSVKSGVVESTVGRFLFNEIIPQDLGFVDRSDPENEFKLEIDFHVGKKGLKQILEKVINIHGAIKTAETLDDDQGHGLQVLHQSSHDRIHFRYDRTCDKEAADLLTHRQRLTGLQRTSAAVLITEEERYKEVIETWKKTDDNLDTRSAVRP